MRPDPSDISGYISETSEQERELLKLFRKDQKLTIFDVGACEGEDSIRYATRFPNSRVFAFEPLASNWELVRANFERYSISNAELVGVALSNSAGEADFHVSSGRPDELFRGGDWNYGNKSSSLLPPTSKSPMYGWVRFEEVVRVRCEVLDDFCRTRRILRIDFVHMDVQGAEALVLAGAKEMMRRIVGIWLEVSDEALYAGQALRCDIERLMRRQGFVRTLQLRRGAEGDQFYVNVRFPRTWPYLILDRMGRVARQMRRAGGRIRRSVLAAFGTAL